MPTAPIGTCSWPTCPARTDRRFCPTHATETERARGSSTARGYDRAWQRLRRAKIAANPICEVAGCSQATTEVDHIRPIARGGERLVWANLQSMCKPHHSAKTMREQRGQSDPAPRAAPPPRVAF